MVEVGGSNPPGPTNEKPAVSGVFYWSIEAGRDRSHGSTNRAKHHRREARRVKTAKAVLSNRLSAANRLYFDRGFTQ